MNKLFLFCATGVAIASGAASAECLSHDATCARTSGEYRSYGRLPNGGASEPRFGIERLGSERYSGDHDVKLIPPSNANSALVAAHCKDRKDNPSYVNVGWGVYDFGASEGNICHAEGTGQDDIHDLNTVVLPRPANAYAARYLHILTDDSDLKITWLK